MPRNQIQLVLTTAEFDRIQSVMQQDPDSQAGMSSRSFFARMGLDPARMEGVRIVQQTRRAEFGAVFLLLEHSSYPQLPDFAEAPHYYIDQVASIYPSATPGKTGTNGA